MNFYFTPQNAQICNWKSKTYLLFVFFLNTKSMATSNSFITEKLSNDKI